MFLTKGRKVSTGPFKAAFLSFLSLKTYFSSKGDCAQGDDATMHVTLPSLPTEENAVKNRIDVRRISFKSKTDPRKVEIASEEILRHANEHLTVDKVCHYSSFTKHFLLIVETNYMYNTINIDL